MESLTVTSYVLLNHGWIRFKGIGKWYERHYYLIDYSLPTRTISFLLLKDFIKFLELWLYKYRVRCKTPLYLIAIIGPFSSLSSALNIYISKCSLVSQKGNISFQLAFFSHLEIICLYSCWILKVELCSRTSRNCLYLDNIPDRMDTCKVALLTDLLAWRAFLIGSLFSF